MHAMNDDNGQGGSVQLDAAHGRCVDQLTQFREPLVTCWPVIAVAGWHVVA